ncbi:hypothetical protein J4E91_008769 [Alternaria rosae]|nr:hypothetical protein J4E91_008769 [Alternaria rosae]
MQRDDNLPLNEIYSTPEAVHEEVERILDLALYKVPENTPLRLRFITPVSVEKWLADDGYNDYRLTTPEEHDDGMAYITVSYCWKHSQSMEILPPLPHYHAHLKIMHRVYKEGEWTVAPLSRPITDDSSLERLITYLYHDCKVDKDVAKEESSGGSPISEGDVSIFRERVKEATELFMSITQDA